MRREDFATAGVAADKRAADERLRVTMQKARLPGEPSPTLSPCTESKLAGDIHHHLFTLTDVRVRLSLRTRRSCSPRWFVIACLMTSTMNNVMMNTDTLTAIEVD